MAEIEAVEPNVPRETFQGRHCDAFSIEALKKREGLKLVPYLDDAGVLTCGYGHTGPDVVDGVIITEEQAELWLKRDLIEPEVVVDTRVTVPLTDSQFGALVSFVFNVGAEAFKTSTLLKVLNAGDYASVATELMKWVNITDPVTGKKRRANGLVNRRASEVGQWARGSRTSGANVSAEPAPSIVRKVSVIAGGAVAAAAGAAEPALDAYQTYRPMLDSATTSAIKSVLGTIVAGLAVLAIIKHVRDSK